MGMHFSNYSLPALREMPDGVFNLADGLLWEMIDLLGCKLSGNVEQDLRGLIKAAGHEKVLQDNIEGLEGKLGRYASEITTTWLTRSGIMNPLSGAFSDPSRPLPNYVDAVVWPGGVANEQLERRNLTEGLPRSGVGRVVLPMGNRKMRPNEHSLVASYVLETGNLPTEAEFGKRYVQPVLEEAGMAVTVLPVDSDQGRVVCEAAFQADPTLLNGTVLVFGSGLGTVQTTGQIRAAACAADSNFDLNGAQLFMRSKRRYLALPGENEEGLLHPVSSASRIPRAALYLYKAMKAAA